MSGTYCCCCYTNSFYNFNKTRLSADILDQGNNGLDRVNHKRPPTPESEGGRGVNIIRHYADSVSFVETAGGGLKVLIRIDRDMEKEYSEDKSF